MSDSSKYSCGATTVIASEARQSSIEYAPRTKQNTSTGLPRFARNDELRGFTLIEILIVIVIISVVSTVAVLTIHFNQHKNLEETANKITNLILLAEQEAILRSTTLNFRLNSHSLQFYEYIESEKSWKPLSIYKIANNTEIHLKNPAEIILGSNGELTAFTLFIGEKNSAPLYKITGKTNGEVTHERIAS